METQRPSLIFDTSAINWLADDQDRDPIVKGLRLAHSVLVTETSISEIISNPDVKRRNCLLDLLVQLAISGGCIMPFHWIVEEQMKAYFQNPQRYNWVQLDVRFRQAEEEIVRRKTIRDLSDQTRAEMQKLRQDFENQFEKIRSAFRQAFALKDNDKAPSFNNIAQAVLSREGEHFRLGMDYIAQVIGVEPEPDRVQNFIERCPPFAALLLALTVALRDRSIRDTNEQWIGKRAGRDDILSAVYLLYCRQFITGDEGQHDALKFIAEWPNHKLASVALYKDFKKFVRFLEGRSQG
jgi:hypothetical protein